MKKVATRKGQLLWIKKSNKNLIPSSQRIGKGVVSQETTEKKMLPHFTPTNKGSGAHRLSYLPGLPVALLPPGSVLEKADS